MMKTDRVRRPAAVLSAALLCAAMTLAANAVIALSTDRDREVEYWNDGPITVVSVDGRRVVTARDNILIRQGSMELRGDVAIFEYDQDNELRKVSVSGNLANFQQETDAGTLVTGSSENIYYYRGDANLVEFIGTARLTEAGSEFNCAEIRHDIGSGATETTGPCSATLLPQPNR